jgi:glycosyltransferase involved in cell wall biosynthesis
VAYPVHDDGQLAGYGLQPEDVDLAIFCSTGLQQRTAWPGRQLVVYPPVLLDEHRVERTGDAITIASLSREKGAELFWELARRLPAERFIGVRGGWGEQIIPANRPANVALQPHQGTDLRAVFQQTRIVLAPSQHLGAGSRMWTENWGRVVVEAAASGIPTIATPTPGPLEALGDAGIFHERNEPDAWVDAIRALRDPAVYQERSARARRRAAELEVIVRRQLDDLEAALDSMCGSSSQRAIRPGRWRRARQRTSRSR